MSPDRLFASLKQEILRNKKKSAILGVMCLVACYFWLPLIWGWIAPGDGDGASPSDASEASFVVESSPPPETQSETSGRSARRREMPWDQMLEKIKEDPRMASASLELLGRSPFSLTDAAPPVQVEDASPPEPEVTAADLTLADMGLQLTGIVYGPRLRIATINGVEYHEHDTVPIAVTGTASAAIQPLPESGASPEANQADWNQAVQQFAAGGLTAEQLTAMRANGLDVDQLLQDPEAGDGASPPSDGDKQATMPTDAPRNDTNITRTMPSVATPISCTVAEIRPKCVMLRLPNGTMTELRLDGAQIGAGDVIRITHTKPR